MESIIPSLFTFSFFAPLILRVAVSVVFLEASLSLWKQQGKGKIIGTTSGVITILLLIGAFTQVAAILGISMIVALSFYKTVPSVFHKKTFALLVIAILIALLLTGAGAMAVDLPY